MQLATCPPAPPVQVLGLMEPSCTGTPFNGAAWAFALATPGYRMLAEVGLGLAESGSGRGVRLHSRQGVDATRRFAEVAQALGALGLEDTVLDGEVCVLDAAGRSRPALLHVRALHPRRQPGAGALVMCLRDVLAWQGRDVRALPWLERRKLLESLPLRRQPALRLCRVVRAEGLWLYRQAQALGVNALHAHHKDAPYVAGRSLAWLSVDVAAWAPALAA